MTPQTIGFIGVGTMGGPMARHLAEAGYTVVAADSRADALTALARKVAVETADSPRAVAERCDVVFTALPDDAALEAVYLGEQGIVQAARAGLLTCDVSTVRPEATRGVHAALGERGAEHMEAPMLGSLPQAESGNIFFIVGGSEAAVARAAPFLEIMGRLHMHVGPVSTGNTIKLIHNALGDVNYAAVAEALGVAAACGVDLATFYEVVQNGGGMAWGNYFERKVPTSIQGDYTPRFKLALAHKDISLAAEMAEGAGVTMPMMQHARTLFGEAMAAGEGEEDASVVTRAMARRIGRPIGLTRPDKA